MRKFNYLFACVATAALVACGGGGGDSTTTVASRDVAVAVNPTTGAAAAQALNGQAISFLNGIPVLGTTGATTLTVTAGTQPTFGISSGGNSADGNLNFGSCIFVITRSTFVAPSPLVLGATVTVSDCKIDLKTGNAVANGGTVSVQATMSLNGTVSAPLTTSLVIQPNGDILVGGSKITSVSVTQVTGGA